MTKRQRDKKRWDKDCKVFEDSKKRDWAVRIEKDKEVKTIQGGTKWNG